MRLSAETGAYSAYANDIIGAIVEPPTLCTGSTTKHVMPTIGSNNLEYDIAPRIARDPVSGVLVVTWDSYEAGVNMVRGRAFVSSNGGTTWSFTLLTAHENGKSAVAAGAGSSFEVGSTYNDYITPSNKAAQVRRRPARQSRQK